MQTHDKLLLNNLTLYARIGVKEAERAVGQWLVVNLEVACDLKVAGESDDLHRTISYSDVARTVTEVGEGMTCQLLEYMAEQMATAVLQKFPFARSVRLQLLKRPPPLGIPIESAGVEIYRERAAPISGTLE